MSTFCTSVDVQVQIKNKYPSQKTLEKLTISGNEIYTTNSPHPPLRTLNHPTEYWSVVETLHDQVPVVTVTHDMIYWFDTGFLMILFRLRNYLALIKRAGGFYGRILTDVVSTDRTQ